eukprot:CAMPEP_0172017154 /NCGR_PEP_ID=MMETSP1041-20130122/11412_1 /TAXON_ID=464988 /ORGANISM="Hemiselmis andersenii, Strain CCMP439" /LENGTH=200 /DNA_ID=CAMNT_0012672163 /DNA_START=13 /DNA_END=611 /DNA_ORIENTATION=+
MSTALPYALDDALITRSPPSSSEGATAPPACSVSAPCLWIESRREWHLSWRRAGDRSMYQIRVGLQKGRTRSEYLVFPPSSSPFSFHSATLLSIPASACRSSCELSTTSQSSRPSIPAACRTTSDSEVTVCSLTASIALKCALVLLKSDAAAPAAEEGWWFCWDATHFAHRLSECGSSTLSSALAFAPSKAGLTLNLRAS